MRLVSDRVQFGVATVVAVVGWFAVMLTSPSPEIEAPIGLGDRLLAARVPSLAMAVAGGSFVLGWVAFDWRRPPRRYVTLACGLLGVLAVLVIFLWTDPPLAYWLPVTLVSLVAAVSVMLVSPPRSDPVETADTGGLPIGDVIRLFGVFGFVLFIGVLPLFLMGANFESNLIVAWLRLTAPLILFALAWRHFRWLGSRVLVVGGSVLLGLTALGLVRLLHYMPDPIALFSVPLAVLFVSGALVHARYPEWVRRPGVSSETPATDAGPASEPPHGVTDEPSAPSPDPMPTNGGTDAPTDDPFAAASSSGGSTEASSPDDPATASRADPTPSGTATDEGTADVTTARPLGPPDRIPRTLNLDVDYADLTEQEPLGRGGNADVYRATVRGGEPVAVKEPRMSGTLHSEAVDRMLAEAETWDKLDDHDHVVGVVDYGAEPLPWIAMEYMDAGDLSARAGELDLAQALWTAEAITEGVRHAHRRGVAHLDLKPANVLFRSVEGAWDVPKVADWGLSKHLLEHSKSVEGLSPQYAAPEQFDTDRGAADDITDVYQLGAVLYELFTGRPPFEGDPTGVMHRVLNEEPTPPSEVADVPPALDDVLLTALATAKVDRYDSVLYLRDAFRDLSDR
ncbi:hypothetical protein EI982_07795 [Haloplanus rallus]|uniref:Protein kinase domain-containing protein n=1 Tax=Haloplanus rallus TaxID=1816183 RepID=A0A6B9F8I7_9EURY|nr:protein kinase [Haloplanus rallus]QGX94704.1 hypothetical protein EI982_07795 [Haloplanus rallus]